MTATLQYNSPKRRDKLVIMTEVLGIAKTGALKTQIMYKANLSFTQLTEYLQYLSQNGLLEKTVYNRKVVFKATLKGINFKERQQQIIDMLNEETPRSRLKSPLEM